MDDRPAVRDPRTGLTSSHRVNVREGLALHVVEWRRAGPPCLFLHGMGDHARVWDEVVNELDVPLRPVAVDLLGHGDSAWDPSRRYDGPTLAADIAAVVATLGLHQLIVVGHSLGAEVAVRLADGWPGVRALVLVDWAPEVSKEAVDHIAREWTRTPRVHRTPEDYVRWLAEQRPLARLDVLATFAHHGVRRRADGRFELKSDPALFASKRARTAVDGASGVRYIDSALAQALQRLTCPTLVVRGEASSLVPADVSIHMTSRLLSSGRLATIQRAGHGVVLDNPVALAAAIQGFCSGLGSFA